MFVLLKASLLRQFKCFWMGFLFKFGHHFFHYHYYLYPVVEFLFSLIFLFRYVILTRGLFSLFLRGKACRKAWGCTWKCDFWQSLTPTSRNVLAHSRIFFCCSGTYGYVIPGVKRGPSVHVYLSVLCIADLDKGLYADISPLSLFFSLSPSSNKSHIVAVFISTASGVCLRLDSKPGTARLLPFWSPFL